MSQILIDLFVGRFSEPVSDVIPMSSHASSRRLVRLKSANRSVVGVEFSNLAENRAFLSFSRHFRSVGLAVPEIYCVASDEKAYLHEDLGSTTLYDLLQTERNTSGEVSDRVLSLYGESVQQLSYFQIEGSIGLDYSLCVEGARFDKDAMLGDCARFVQELVKRMGLSFNETRLKADFQGLVDFLDRAESDYFLYRDFQARNIMVRDGKPYFIDYQSGRRGALQYDLASLLYQSQARLSEKMREQIINVYLAQVSLRRSIDHTQFLEFFDGFALIRLIQVLGAYGKLGLGEQKEYFLKGIPFAVSTFLEVLSRERLPQRLPEVTALFARLVASLQSEDF